MSKVIVTESYLEDIGDAIRAKLGGTDTYKPSEMSAAIGQIHGEATLETLSVTENGTYTPSTGVDGFSRVDVNVQGGGSSDWGLIDEAILSTDVSARIVGDMPLDITEYSSGIQTFYNSYARTKPTTVSVDHEIVNADRGKTLAEITDISDTTVTLEYYGYVYNQSIIADCEMVLLGDFSQGGVETGNALTDDISNYSAIVLQGIYQKQRTSNYNTSMLYTPIKINTAYWAGMKDRNSSYDCYVTFTDNTHASLSGNKQVIIYGIPV